MRQRAIFCPDAPTDCASEASAGQSIARSVQPSTAVQTLTSLVNSRKEVDKAEREEVEEESSEEESSEGKYLHSIPSTVKLDF